MVNRRPKPMLLALSLTASIVVAAETPETTLVVALDPETHRLEATASMVVRDLGNEIPVFRLHRAMEVLEARIDGAVVEFHTEIRDDVNVVRVEPGGPLAGPRTCSLSYAGVIHDPPEGAGFSREWVSAAVAGTIQPEGVFLAPSSRWYPALDHERPSTFDLRVTVPAGWEAVSEGDRSVVEAPDGGGKTLRFRTEAPVDGLHLVAGPWTRHARDHGGIEIAVLVFPEDEDLAPSYLDGVARYLDLYQPWLGEYAFSRFDVVENFFDTGYGMPGFTVLGRRVMRLPFIVHTSLGHEVAHSWWGNGVYVDESGGNWCEGLTTYVADYHYKAQRGDGEAAQYRREMARSFTNYVSGKGNDFPLVEFTERSDPASRAIGYGKSMMVFHMLERRLGTRLFNEALRDVYATHLHREASWTTWKDAFSRHAGEDLGWFFEQWVDRPGAPSLELNGATLVEIRRPDAEGNLVPEWEVSGNLIQSGGRWRLRVPLVFEAGDRSETRLIETDKDETEFHVTLPFGPEVLRVDPDQEILRRLDPMEMPPILSRVLGDPDTVLVVETGGGEELTAVYRKMAAEFAERQDLGVVEASSVKPRQMKGKSVFMLGLPPEGSPARTLLEQMPAEIRLGAGSTIVSGREFTGPGGAVLAVGRNPGDPDRAVALFHAYSPAAAAAAGRKLKHYGKYSFLAFVDGENRAKGVAAVTGGPLVHRFE